MHGSRGFGAYRNVVVGQFEIPPVGVGGIKRVIHAAFRRLARRAVGQPFYGW